MRRQLLSPSFAVLLAVAGAGCSSSDGNPPAGPGGNAAGTAGAGGQTGPGMGVGGAGAKAGASGGSAGASQTGGTGAGGNQGGKGGGVGAGGASGKGGMGAACKVDADCAPLVPPTVPQNCALGQCDLTTHTCVFSSKDEDKDGHANAHCKSTDGTPVVVGDDCDDTSPIVFPGSWDGPKGDGNPDRCDGVDEDCDGIVDDGKLKNGTTCTCAPGDVQTCSEDAGGKPISFPTGKPLGACKFGAKTCAANGVWGPCIGAVAPEPVDRCDAKDENCNGLVDMADTIPPINQITFTFDGDNDNFADSSHPTEAKTSSCPSTPPAKCPSYLDTKKFPCDPKTQWRTVSLPLKDCNDNDPNVFPGAQEFCNKVDDDCNGTADDPYAVDAANWYYDYDGDNYGDLNVKSVHQCYAPTTVPPACTSLATNLPGGYCAGLPAEGNAPTCPPSACDTSMWVKNVPQIDCKDRPDEDNPTGGLKPELVHPGAKDLCNGHDYDCDGAPNTGCACSPVGGTQPCGDAATCNAGTQTCSSGGVWGSCSGGNPQAKNDYCPDADSDGYCELGACQSAVCPLDAAMNPALKLKSLCQPITDCNDADPAIHPAPAETCNGDGKDYNCNGTPNTPGKGDCACIAGTPNIACAPTGYIYPAGKTPGDPLVGVCQWGNQSCNPDGTLTPCTGGVSGFATEQCASLDGKDYDCNGVADTAQCNCKNGDIQSCENVTLCNKGCTQTCMNGKWGPNSVPNHAQLSDCYPDADHDGVCGGGSAQSKCPPGTWGNDPVSECATDCVAVDATRSWREGKNCIGAGVAIDCNDGDPTVHPYFSQPQSAACGAGTGQWTQIANPGAEVCNDGKDSDCNGDPNNALGVGLACDVQGKAVGACLAGGVGQCSGMAVACVPNNASIGIDAWESTPANNSGDVKREWDWNCNTTVENAVIRSDNKVYTDLQNTPVLIGCQDYGVAANFNNPAAFCNALTPQGQSSCTNAGRSEFWWYADCNYVPPYLGGSSGTPCGQPVKRFVCFWSSNSCMFSGFPTENYVVQCK